MIELRKSCDTFLPEFWDEKLFSFDDYHFMQTYSYGEYSRNLNVEVFRVILTDGDKPLVMAQGLLRKTFLGGCILTIRGGPAYQSTNNEKLNLKYLRMFFLKLIEAINKDYRYCYINIIMYNEHEVATNIVLREAGLMRPFFERTPYITYMVTIYDDLNKNMKNFVGKWRNQLRKSESQNPRFVWGNDESNIKAYVELHNTMCQIKSIESFNVTYEDILDLHKNCGEQLQLFIGYKDNDAVCGCMVHVVKEKAYYYYAAANEDGRRGYYSNSMVWFLLKKLQSRGVRVIDMSSVDPTENWGGYHFKKGTGGELYAYTGEWDYSSSQFLKILMNAILFWRTKRMYQ